MSYSDAERTAALLALAANGNDVKTTAKQVKVDPRTLYKWQQQRAAKKHIPEMIETAIGVLLERIPKLSGRDWGITLGILIDKWLLMQGAPTSRAENIVKGLNDLPAGQRSAVLNAAERILAGAVSSGVAASFGDEHDA